MRTVVLTLILIFSLAATCFADVIRMVDGTIYLGKVATAEEGVVSIEAFGKTIRAASTEIIKTETDFTSLRAQPLDVILVDGSVIHGKVRNFDQEIGLFVELEIGELTIPLESLRALEDPTQRARYRGFPVQAGLSIGYSIPLEPFATTFSSGLTASFFAEMDLGIIRGLFASLDVSQFFLAYLPSTNLAYSITTLTAGPFYRFLFLRTAAMPVLRDLVPWLGLGGGLAYVGVRDLSSQASYGEIDPVYDSGAGFDYYIGERLLIRAGFRWIALQQAASLLHMPSFGIGAAFSF